jgi:hypothetical protein
MEGEKAIKAMAHYLARLVYRLVTKGQEYVDRIKIGKLTHANQ